MTDQNALSDSPVVSGAQLPGPAQPAGGSKYGPFLPTVVISLLLLSLLAGALIYLASFATNAKYAYITMLLGAVTGWPSGMYFSPYGDNEKKSFVSAGQAASAFVSGYLLSKLDRLLENTLFVANPTAHDAWLLAAYFVAAFAIFAIGTYTCRRYFSPDAVNPI